MHALNAQREELEGIRAERQRKKARSQAERLNLEDIETFCANVSEGLNRLTFSEREDLLRLLVERITVEGGHVSMGTIIPIGDDGVQLRTRRPETVEPSLSEGPFDRFRANGAILIHDATTRY